MTMISVDEALARIYNSIPALKITRLPLHEAHGFYLAQDALADRDFPPFHRVAMDGVAVNMASLMKGKRKFKIEGTVAAGKEPKPLVFVDACLEVMTGAVLPMGTNIVIPYEELTIENNCAVLPDDFKPVVMKNVHQQGSDCKKGDIILKRGTCLRAPEIAALASIGCVTPALFAAPKIAVVSTGDELVDISEPSPKNYQIRKSNSGAIWSLLKSFANFEINLFHFKDDRELLYKGLEEILADHEMVIISGGVSKGKFDFVPSVLHDLKVKEVLHKVKQRPGKPLWFGTGPLGQFVFGLPGNPISALFSCRRYVVPALGWMISGGQVQGVFEGEKVPSGETYEAQKGLTFFKPCHFKHGQASFYNTNGSGDLLGICGSDGFMQLPADKALGLGDEVLFFGWRAP